MDKPIAISLAWKLEPPAAGTRTPLNVRFPWPLDHGILVRALSVETADHRRVDGIVALDLHDVGWTFIPATAWTAGAYNLVAQGFLEDPQGNQLGRAFESSTDLPDSPRASGAADAPSRLAFTVGSTR